MKKPLNLIGNYKPSRTKGCGSEAKQQERIPTKLSSSSFLIFCTLHMLKDRDAYSAEILSEARSFEVNVWNPSHGTLSDLLKNMIDDGFVTITKDTPSRKYYGITALGKKEYKLMKDDLKPQLIGSNDFFNTIDKQFYPVNVK